MVYTAVNTVLPNSTIQNLTEHNSKPQMFQGPLPGQCACGCISLRSMEKKGLFHKEKSKWREEEGNRCGKEMVNILSCHKSVLRFHYTVAISIPQIFLLASCLSFMASPVAQTVWSFSSTGLRAEALPTCNTPLEILLFSTLLHHLQPPSGEEATGIWNKTNFVFIVCVTCANARKAGKFQEYSSLYRHEVHWRHVSSISIQNDIFSFLLPLALDVACLELDSNPHRCMQPTPLC